MSSRKAMFDKYCEVRIGKTCWCIQASSSPQTYPKRVIDQAIRQGDAVPYQAKKKSTDQSKAKGN